MEESLHKPAEHAAGNRDRKLRCGFTTGSCAAAAAGAACRMLFTGKVVSRITIITPRGIPFTAQITDIDRKENEVTCGVIKDGGDDPDVTTGLHILAKVEFISRQEYAGSLSGEADLHSGTGASAGADKNPAVSISKDPAADSSEDATADARAHPAAGSVHSAMGSSTDDTSDRFPAPVVIITGGPGVGRVTKPGLDQPVGEAAINHVPRQMIREQVELAMKLCDVQTSVRVTIMVPGGQERAKKTFNPRLGITGGISILGTSGIVEPMSEQALKDTIRVELSQKKALGWTIVPVSPGNYGLEFMQRTYGYNLDLSVKCSNYIGDTIDMAAELGFKGMLLTGHIGKLVKVSGGIMNTHSKEGDCRMELMAAAAIRCGADADTARQILSSVTTVEAIQILRRSEAKDSAARPVRQGTADTSAGENGRLLEQTMENIMDRIMYYLRRRADQRLQIECMMYTNEDGLLAQSKGTEDMLATILAYEP